MEGGTVMGERMNTCARAGMIHRTQFFISNFFISNKNLKTSKLSNLKASKLEIKQHNT